MIDIILQSIQKHWMCQLERDVVISNSRDRWKAAYPRFIVMYFLKKQGLTYTKIGKEFGRDHSTVVNALQTLEDLKHTEKAFAKLFDEIEAEIGDKLKEKEPEKFVFKIKRKSKVAPNLLTPRKMVLLEERISVLEKQIESLLNLN